LKLPDLWAAEDCFESLFSHELWLTDQHFVANHTPLGRDVSEAIREGQHVCCEPTLHTRVNWWRRKLLRIFDRVQLLALPTLPILTPTLHEVETDPSKVIDLLVRHTAWINLAGFPALTVPLGPDAVGTGTHSGLQLVGPPYSELLLLATVQQLEASM